MSDETPLDQPAGRGREPVGEWRGTGPTGPGRPSATDGFRVGPYRAVGRLGAGATAQTWAGVDERTGRPVALKVFPPGGLEAARQEATLARVVDHPHLPDVLDVVADPVRPTLVTELASGGTLSALLDRAGPLGVGQALTVLIPIASALATAHERRVVHGDLSTDNIVLDAAGRPLLIDLGAGRAEAGGGDGFALTPCHAAPEAASGGGPSTAADVFALGSVARSCLVGEPAWSATELVEVADRVRTGPWPDVPDSIGSAPLAALVRAMLRPDPARRPGAASLVVGLRAVGRPEPLPMAAAASAAAMIGPDGPGVSGRLGVDLDGHDGAAASPSHVLAGPGGLADAGRPPAPTEPVALGDAPVPHRLGEAPEGPDAARALTRARLMATTGERAARSDPPGPGRRGHRRGEASSSPGGFGRRKWVAGLMAAAVVIGLAVVVSGGLFETGPSATSVAAPPTAAAPAMPAAAAAGPVGPGTATPAVPGTSVPGTDTSETRVSGTSVPAASVPPASAPAAFDPTAPDPVTASGTDPAALPAGPPPSSTPPGGDVDWLTVVRTLSAERGRALSQGDVTLLDRVYVAGPARTADLSTLELLRSDGTTVSGAAHEIASAGLIGPVGPGTDRPTGSGLPGVRVLVTDRLPSYDVQDASGVTVARTTARPGAALVMTLVRTDQGYRIEEVAAA